MNNEKMIHSIREICKKNNITITKLEEELKFSQGLISRWKDKTPSLDKIVDIADYFHISLDEVVGYNQNIGDEFLNKLYNETSNNSIKWISHKKAQELGYKVKRYTITYNDDICAESNYVFQFDKGYVILYAFYEHGRMLSPKQLYLFIQPSEDSNLIEQEYRRDHLLKLWTKVLNSLDEAPDEVKVEDFKNSFINEFNNKQVRKKSIIYVPKPSNHKKSAIDNAIKNIFEEKGNFLLKITPIELIEYNGVDGITDASKNFYNKHKTVIGKITEARLINYKDLYLISETQIMKLSGFTWGKQCGAHGFNGLLEVLNDAGFEVNAHTNFDGKDFTLLPPCNK